MILLYSSGVDRWVRRWQGILATVLFFVRACACQAALYAASNSDALHTCAGMGNHGATPYVLYAVIKVVF